VRALIWKELREQINLLALSSGAIVLIFVFHTIMRHVKPDHYWAGHDAIVTFVFIMWLVLSTGAIAGAFSADRDRGSDRFIGTLPVRPLWIWIIKISVAAGVMAVVVITTLATAWIFGYSRELELILPHLVVPLRLIGVMAICTLLVASFFVRALTIWLTGLLLGGVLIMGYFFMVLFLAWEPSLPQWSIFITLGCMVAVSAWASGLIMRGGFRHRFSNVLVILFVSGVALLSISMEYFVTFYRMPDLETAETLTLAGNGQYLLVQSDMIAPIHVMDLDTGSIRRVSRRFTICSWGKNISASQSGRYIFVQQYGYLFGLFPLSRSACDDIQGDPAVRAIQRHLHMGSRPVVNFHVIDLKTGHRYALNRFEGIQTAFPLGWHPRDDLLICLSVANTANGRERNLCLYSPHGNLISEQNVCLKCTYMPSYDRESIVKVHFGDMDPIKPREFTYEYLVIGSTDWNPVDSIEVVPRISPDKAWEIQIEGDDSGTSHFICKSRNDLDKPVVNLGSMSTSHPVFRWAPDSSFVLYRRDDRTGEPTLALYDLKTRAVITLANDISDAFSQIARSQQMYFEVSADGRWIAIKERTNRSASLFAFSTDNPRAFKVWEGADALGWEDGKRLLYRTGNKLRVWNPKTDEDSKWHPGFGRRQA